MATITPVLPAAGGTAVTLAAASAGGDSVATGYSARCVLLVRNASGSSVTVTLTGAVACSQGSLHNVTATAPAGQDTHIALPSNVISPTTGQVAVGYSAVTSVTVAAYYEN